MQEPRNRNHQEGVGHWMLALGKDQWQKFNPEQKAENCLGKHLGFQSARCRASIEVILKARGRGLRDVCVSREVIMIVTVDTVFVLPTQSSEGNLVCKKRSKYHCGRAGPGVSGRILSCREAVSLILKTANKTQTNPNGSPAVSWYSAFGSWSYCAKWKKLWAEGFLSGASIHTADRTRKSAATEKRLIVARFEVTAWRLLSGDDGHARPIMPQLHKNGDY